MRSCVCVSVSRKKQRKGIRGMTFRGGGGAKRRRWRVYQAKRSESPPAMNKLEGHVKGRDQARQIGLGGEWGCPCSGSDEWDIEKKEEDLRWAPATPPAFHPFSVSPSCGHSACSRFHSEP